MLSVAIRTLLACAFLAAIVPRSAGAAGAAGDDELAHVRARGVVRCAGIVRPGIAVPTPDGKRWYGIAPDVCRAIAAAVFGDASRMTFRPYLASEPPPASPQDADDVVFLGSADLLRRDVAPLALGPAVVHDAIGLLVPASGATTLTALAGKSICVEPGTPADRALTAYFAGRSIALQEHPYQETDEMRQAYGDGKCAALAGPLTTLANVRGDPQEGHPADRILPDVLEDDPIFAATGADATWSQVVWWTFSALVAAESDGLTGRTAAAGETLPGVPPAVGTRLGLRAAWWRDALAAEGSYGEIFERDLGSQSRLRLPRGIDALAGRGGAIFGLRVE